jgi:hypothetical protein
MPEACIEDAYFVPQGARARLMHVSILNHLSIFETYTRMPPLSGPKLWN